MTSRSEPAARALEELGRRREAIAAVDRRILDLLAERMRLGREIGALKQEAGLPVLDPAREAEVIRAVVAAARELELPSEGVRELWWRIIALARGTQASAVDHDAAPAARSEEA